MWIAKNKDTGKTYGHRYNSIYDCQNFIDNELKEEQDRAMESYINSNCKKYTINDLPNEYKKYPLWFQYHIIDMLIFFERIKLSMSCNRILCWNIGQKRFCGGFDF